ncbi:hypothetical protein [Rhizobium halophytocola]|uniref:Uncharacterized protein n=1 Tax=Rhizobium halophytocola TaxID=735519 RepID=A0ABS4E3H7_9HYPH|nr:hypothetical protein [Rhizobium halophytocola]MBP1852489.1 hypothetical protein [Rhizobium halophytocola]
MSMEDETQEDAILLARVDSSYWLLDGEPYLTAMLSAQAPYPKPVRCLEFATVAELNAVLPEGQTQGALWGVHPAIIDRLKRHDELVLVEFADDD